MTSRNKTRTFRWLFHLSLLQVLACLILPVFLFPGRVLLSIELFVALTVGPLFGLYFLGVNIYGLFIDRERRPIYGIVIILTSVWAIWAVLTWLYIDHMRYLN